VREGRENNERTPGVLQRCEERLLWLMHLTSQKTLWIHGLLRRFGKHSIDYKGRIPRFSKKMTSCVSN
jgi:hypothetical protein